LRRPPSVHGSFDRECVEERDGVLATIASEVTVVVVDHRDARTHETRDRENRDARPQREGGVCVAQVVKTTRRLDAGSRLNRLPVTTAEDAEVDPTPSRVREEDRVLGSWKLVERVNRDRL
jgi:hypothetical protein